MTLSAGTLQESLAARLADLAKRSTSNAIGLDDAAKRALLEHRARELAAPRAQVADAVATDMLDVLIFTIGEERLAMALASIIAIISAAVVTPLPLSVPPVYGVTAWRGRPLTVLSVGTGTVAGDAGGRLIVLGYERRAPVGLLADTVEETRVVARSGLSAPQAGPRREIAIGLTDDGVLVLDAEALLNTARPES